MHPAKLHITQDKHGFWMLCVEDEFGMRAIACHFTKPDHLVHDALEYVKKGVYPGATTLIDAPDPQKQLSRNPTDWPNEYEWPEPQVARI